MHFLSETLEQYIAQHSESEPQVLQELTRETHLKVIQPRMITGHFQGRVLSFLSKMVNPKYILEIGTFTGYSAICLAEGLSKNGVLHTIDINEELKGIQKKYFRKSDYESQIVAHAGDALKILPDLDITFDLVFIDAQKTSYDAYFEAAIAKTKPGSIIISDNVLWSGKVIEPIHQNDKATEVLVNYNQKLKEDPRVTTVLLPIRDGLTLSRVL